MKCEENEAKKERNNEWNSKKKKKYANARESQWRETDIHPEVFYDVAHTFPFRYSPNKQYANAHTVKEADEKIKEIDEKETHEEFILFDLIDLKMRSIYVELHDYLAWWCDFS